MRGAVIVPPHQQADQLACLGVVVNGLHNQQLRGVYDVIVHWGINDALPSPPQARFRFNRPEALALAADVAASRQLWRLAGLKQRRSLPRSGYYRVCIADLQPVAVYRLRRPRTYHGGPVRRRGYLRPVVTGGKVMQDLLLAAQRALHVLRLDFGVVDMALNSKREPQILRVVPSPAPHTRLGHVLSAALARRLPNLLEQPRRAVIGADPEFLFRDRRRGRLVPVSRFLSLRGSLGVDSQQMKGRPGVRPIGEVRPRPHSDPDLVVRRIRHLLARLHRRVPRRNYAWIAGNGFGSWSTGGHIHFSRIRLSAGLMRALDVYAAVPFLLIENAARARRRRRRYGGLGDFRQKPWGFEYRAMPSWLVSPRFAAAALSLGKLVAENWWDLQRDPFLEPRYQEAFYRCDKDIFQALFPTLWADLERLPDYKLYAHNLSALRELVEKGADWGEEKDFRSRWGVVPQRGRHVNRRRMVAR